MGLPRERQLCEFQHMGHQSHSGKLGVVRRSVCQPEKRKVGGSSPPLTTDHSLDYPGLSWANAPGVLMAGTCGRLLCPVCDRGLPHNVAADRTSVCRTASLLNY